MNFTCIIFYSLIYITNIYSSILNDKSLLVEYSVPQDCIYQPLGLMNHKHFSDINTTMFLIGNIAPLSCICSTEINEIGRYYEEEFLGIRGAMINNDCGALRFFVRYATKIWKQTHTNENEKFIYAETGSFLGLSSHIAVSSAQEENVSIVVYAHDLFDLFASETELWHDLEQNEKSYLERFYDSVRMNNLMTTIIPIVGKSHLTLKIHPPNSVDMIFIDGDHSYEGALLDLRQGWKILKSGGYMLGHDCLPEENEVFHSGMGLNGVRKALFQFLDEIGLYPVPDEDGNIVNRWWIINGTAFMFVIMKP